MEQRYARTAAGGPDHLRIKSQLADAERELISIKSSMPVESSSSQTSSSTSTTTVAPTTDFDKVIAETAAKTAARAGEVSEGYEQAKRATAFNAASRAGFMAGGEKGTPTQVLVQNVAKVNDDIGTKLTNLEMNKQKDLTALEQNELATKGNLLQAKSNATIQDEARKSTDAYNARLLAIQEQAAIDARNAVSTKLATNASQKASTSTYTPTGTTGKVTNPKPLDVNTATNLAVSVGTKNAISTPSTGIGKDIVQTTNLKGPSNEIVYRLKDGRYIYFNGKDQTKFTYFTPKVLPVTGAN